MAVVATAAAAIAGALVIGMPGASDDAYASWTATPAAVASSERGLAGDACLEGADRSDGEVVLAERRGVWIAVAATTGDGTDEPAVVTCLVELPPGSTDPGVVISAVGGGQGAVPVGGEITEGIFSEFSDGAGDGSAVSFTVGDVGPDVAAVELVGPDGETVDATVSDGRFIAWWPGRVFEEGTEGPGLVDLDYRVTLVDGTVVEDAQPIRPE